MNEHFTQDDFEGFREMEKMVRRARRMDEISQVVVGVGLVVFFALIVRFLVG